MISVMNEEKFSDEEMRVKRDLEQAFEQARAESRKFWSDEYPAMTRDQRIKYWLGDVLHGMRSQGEATGDAYSEFSPEWHSFARSMEPDFDELFREAVKALESGFDWMEYYRRING